MTPQKEKIKEITEQLEQGIKDLFNSEKFKTYLDTMSKFHNYSFNNTILIAMQRPDATYVAGYKAWEKFERHVNKGEKGIKIIAPAPYKKKVDEEIKDAAGNLVYNKDGTVKTEKVEHIIPSFRVTTVFDLAQTSGKELPSIVKKLDNSIDAETFDNFMDAIKKYSPVSINFDNINSGVNGFYSLESKTITIKNDMTNDQTIKTTIHEVAHSILHDRDTGTEKDNKLSSRDREVQAEAVAYTVCKHFGFDTSDYSFGYIAGWSSGKELDELKESMQTIRECANNMICGISAEYNKLERHTEMEEKMEGPILAEPTLLHHKIKM